MPIPAISFSSFADSLMPLMASPEVGAAETGTAVLKAAVTLWAAVIVTLAKAHPAARSAPAREDRAVSRRSGQGDQGIHEIGLAAIRPAVNAIRDAGDRASPGFRFGDRQGITD